MQTTTDETVINRKTRELCQAILDEPAYQSIRSRIEAFMADEQAKDQFQKLNEKGEYLQHKQQQGVALSGDEIAEFEKERDALLSNPLARDFIEAQQEMQEVQSSVGQYVSKTLELGRVPTEDELGSGGCGHGCGCHH